MTESPRQNNADTILTDGQRTLALESQAIAALQANLGQPFINAVQALLACKGRVIVSGLGKSGHIARKIAATLSSTGTPSLFMHAAEALHGDLGTMTGQDVLVAISYSGNGQEWQAIVPSARRHDIPIIAITGNPDSELAKLSDILLDIAVQSEACPLNLAPTTSTTVTLALGDALAVACLNARQFKAEDFAMAHPGGTLGRRLLTHVRDVMRTGHQIPQVTDQMSITDALQEMSHKGMGMTAVVDATGRAIGIFTDGDLRRLLNKEGDVRQMRVVDGMTAHPQHIEANAMAIDAAQMMEQRKITQLLVAHPDGTLAGALHMHDLMHAKII